jgi:hypothetical protein
MFVGARYIGPGTVTLSTLVSLRVNSAKGLAALSDCHPERSEGSASIGTEMLRCAQHDNVALRVTVPAPILYH